MNRVNEKLPIGKKTRNVKCELNKVLVMNNLYVKFDINSSSAKQFISAKIGGQTDGQTAGRAAYMSVYCTDHMK